MRAISLWQPAAQLCAAGAQRFLVQKDATDYVGPLAIHAGMKFPTAEKERTMTEPVRSLLRRAYGKEVLPKDLAVMAIVGVVCLDRCVRITDARADLLRSRDPVEFSLGHYDLSYGPRYVWVLSRPWALEPIDCPGQGFWEPPPEIRRQIAEQRQRSLAA